MALESGSRLGPYEIIAPLGAGGMGEVYRARDPKLGRDVAIKLLPDAFADDPERLARFEREAKLLASLQHANIAVLHGLEEADGRRYLVMQCVEGESLAERLARGPLGQPETLEIMVAVAAALEAAHESGIVHRDLKPGNIMVTPTGDVRVLDFGLAKAGANASGSSTDVGLSASPTRTYAATNAGVILGTAAYMSPEQSRGKPVDRRTDIWSFGCVLFECLTGQQAFAGETVSDIVARILQTEPEWSALPPNTSPRLRDLMQRCLQKDARRRLRDIGDARVELEDLISGRVPASGVHAAPATLAAPRAPWLVPAMAALVVAAALASWFASRALRTAPAASPARFVISAPRGQQQFPDGVGAAISPDGTMLASIAADSAGIPHVWIRRFDTLLPKMLPGTDQAIVMFWSPDSRFIAFFANDRQLSKVAVAGGDPEPICDTKVARGGTWSRDGVILLAPYSMGALYRVPAAGGEPVAVLRPDSSHGETGLRFPSFLPDGKHFLYASMPFDSSGKVRIYVGSLDGGASRMLLRAETGAIYAEPGWLLYTRRGTVVAQHFDARTLALRGDPVPLGDVALASTFGSAPVLTASANGVLAYVTHDKATQRLAWFDFAGKELAATTVPPGYYAGLKLSPDQHHALMTVVDAAQNEYIGLADLERGVVAKVSPPDEAATFAVWAPDGQRFAFMRETGHQGFVVGSMLDDTRRDYLDSDPAIKRLDEWTADGKYLIYDRLGGPSKWDIWAVPLDGGGPARALAATAANEQLATVSPDGKWLAFISDESGVVELYVVPFGSTGMRYQVTNGGGGTGTWTPDSRHLLFTDVRHPAVAVIADVLPGATFALGPARVLVHPPEGLAGADPARDGKRFLGIVPAEKARPQTVTIVQNWTSALRKP